MIIPYLRSQSQLLADVRARMRDAGKARWTDPEVYAGLNEGLLHWYRRVSIPHLYTIPGGWVSGTADYSLPAYIRGHIDPQQRRYSSHWLQVSGISSEADTWVDVQGFTVEPNGSGGQTLRLDFSPATDDGRVIWWAYNGQLPTTIPTLNAELSSSATSLTLASAVDDIDDAGYIRIGSEWLHYAGVTRGASTTTLSNLLRAVNNTTAATHSSGADVLWGVGAHRPDLYNQLYDYVRGYLHGLFLTNAAEAERAHHERLSLYYTQQADMYWRRYVPNRKTKLRLGREAVGNIAEESAYHHYTRTWGVQL